MTTGSETCWLPQVDEGRTRSTWVGIPVSCLGLLLLRLWSLARNSRGREDGSDGNTMSVQITERLRVLPNSLKSLSRILWRRSWLGMTWEEGGRYSIVTGS